MLKIQNILDYFFLIATSAILVAGSLGIYRELVIYIFIVISVLALGAKLIMDGTLILPKFSIYYLLFLITLVIHGSFFNGNIFFTLAFVSGGLAWLQIANYKDIFEKHFINILVFLSIIMSFLYIYSFFKPIEVPTLVSLFAPPTETIRHSNIGDLWAIAIVSLSFVFIKYRSLTSLPILVVGFIFVILSLSRDAVVTIITGVLFVSNKLKTTKKLENIFLIVFALLILVFIAISTQKTVLFSRPYFLHAISGLVKYPMGTGIGNFSLVSNATNLVHNLPLEVVSGLGIFSVFFLLWLCKVLKEYIFQTNQENVLWRAIFVAILVNFCFNTTYVVPSFFWVWFMALALI